MAAARTPAQAVAEAAVKSWGTSYGVSLKETECADAGCSTFVAICSKPTKTRPVPECVANVHIVVDETGEEPTVSYRSESLVYLRVVSL